MQSKSILRIIFCVVVKLLLVAGIVSIRKYLRNLRKNPERVAYVGSDVTDIRNWSMVVAVETTTGTFCTGVLISHSHVLTAAHCVHVCYLEPPSKHRRLQPKEVFVKVGFLNALESDVAEERQTIPVHQITVGDNFNCENKMNFWTTGNDLAILGLLWPIPESFFKNNYARKIRLMNNSKWASSETEIKFAGYSRAERNFLPKLRNSTVHYMTTEKCWQERRKYLRMHRINETASIPPDCFCTSNDGNGIPAPGDSGGPLFIEDPTDTGQHYLIGIHSGNGYGIDGRTPQIGDVLSGIHVRVDMYYRWIQRKIS